MMEHLPTILPLLGAVALASLVGSGHCVGMCGVFATVASGALDGTHGGVSTTLTVRGRRSMLAGVSSTGAYTLGRLTTYVTAGALAGLLGSALNFGGQAIGFQRAALVLAGATMILFGVLAFLRQLGIAIPRPPLPGILQHAVGQGHRTAMGLRPVPRALLIGLLSTFLPCGWLYAFVVIAAGTADARSGALVMAAFWLGTVPALAAVGLGARALIQPLRAKAPALVAVLPLIIAGLGVWTLLGRFHVPPLHVEATPSQPTIESVRSIAEEVPACCRGHVEDEP